VAKKLEREIVGNFCHKTASLAVFINFSYSMTEKSSIWNKPMKGSQPNTIITVWCKTFLKQVLCLRCLGILCFTPWYSFILFLNILTHCIETIEFILLHTWYQDISFNFTAATLSSAVGVFLLRPWIERLNFFNLLKMSGRYASYCKHGISEKQLANGVPVLDF